MSIFSNTNVYGIYAIKDIKLGQFLNIYMERNDNTAKRGFLLAAQDEDTMFNKSPEDYEMWRIGTFTLQTGEIAEAREFICNRRG